MSPIRLESESESLKSRFNRHYEGRRLAWLPPPDTKRPTEALRLYACMKESQMTELLKLHVGCGKRFIPGFVHVDQVTFPHVDRVQDIRRLGNFADSSASLIYACQVIEYFDREEVVNILTDWRRVLAPGGILRLSVPNFAIICKLYQSGIALDKFLGTLYGRIPDGKNGFVYHRTTYDEASLKELLGKLGFNEIGLWDWRQTEHAHVDDFSQAYFPHMDKEHGLLFNLNMQGKK